VHRFRLRGVRVTPALVISMIALFVALSSTGFASTIVPLAKRALTADHAKVATTADKAKVATTAKTAKTAGNALKLNGATADELAAIPGPATDAQTLTGQTAQQIAAIPGPASSIAASTFTLRSKGWSVQNQGNTTQEKVFCDTGEKAVGGGFDMAQGWANPTIDSPLPDLTGWTFKIWALSGNNVPANGSVWVVCAKVS
jgi:hypothetical protein